MWIRSLRILACTVALSDDAIYIYGVKCNSGFETFSYGACFFNWSIYLIGAQGGKEWNDKVTARPPRKVILTRA